MATGISFSGSNFPIFIEEQPLSDLSRRSSAFFPFPFAPLFLNSRQEIKFFPVVSFLPPSSPVRYLAGERQFRRRRKFNREQGFSRCQRFNHWTAINASRPSLSYFSLRFVRPRNSSSVLSRLPAIPDASWNCLIITSLADSDPLMRLDPSNHGHRCLRVCIHHRTVVPEPVILYLKFLLHSGPSSSHTYLGANNRSEICSR